VFPISDDARNRNPGVWFGDIPSPLGLATAKDLDATRVMRDLRAYWAALALLALVGCQNRGETLDAGEGASIGPAMGCPKGRTEMLSQTALTVMPTSAGQEAAQYCGRSGISVIGSPTLTNASYPDGVWYPYP
jgi:hypothetical protein